MTPPDHEPLEGSFLPAYEEARVASTWRRIAARRWPARRARRGWVIAGTAAAVAAVAAAAAVVAVGALGDRGEAQAAAALVLRDGSPGAVPGTVWTGAAGEVALADESRIALGAGARLQVLANEGTRFTTLLQAGSAHFDVHPGGPRRWEIETALASVEVVGTAFTVALRDGELEVDVDRGVVLVHGERVPGRVARLTAGEHLVVAPAPLVVDAPPVAAAASPAPSPIPSPSPTPTPTPTPSPTPTRIATRSPTRSPVVSLPPVAEVIAAADQLTSSGDPASAAKLLEQVRRRTTVAVPTDREAGLVAFTLGRLYLDALDRPELAASVFDDVIARGSPRSLLEDAYARRAEALIRAGLRDRAAAAIDAYARAYPQGRRLAALRALARTEP